MKLNNKGFAITAVLYGLLILFVILVSSYLLVLSAKKDRVEELVNEIEQEYVGIMSEVNLSDYITNLYTDASKTTITNNGIEYNYAVSVNLMNDRQGGATSDYSGGNIRYYGASPNNYIYFNCSDYSKQSESTCEKWRIIGIVDGKVKLIRNESIGNYFWDDDSNDWSTATLNTYLNGDYYSSLSTTTQGLISNSTYYLGGYYTAEEVYSDQIYNYERTEEVGTTIYSGNLFTVETNIGIMYASDYGYGTDFNECDSNLYRYYRVECYNNDWLFNNDVQWLITPNSANSVTAWDVIWSGYVNYLGGSFVSNEREVRPVLYLNSELNISSDGDGSSSNPYQIYYY